MTGELTRFGVLGPLTCERDDQPVVVPPGHQRTLLALMLQAGGVPLSRDHLIDELWGEAPPATAVSALHVHLSKLRALLGTLIESGDTGYALRADGFALDSWEFDALLERARGAEADDAQGALALVEQALTLVRGHPLAGFAADGTVGRWQHALEEKLLQARLQRADILIELGAGPELVAELEQLLAEHPFEQRLWCQLLITLFRGGRQAEALDAFQRARRLFTIELGIDPGPALTELHQRVLDGDATLQGTASVAAEPSLPASSPGATVRGHFVSALPSPVTGLVGRARELETLGQLLADRDVRLITLTGLGGVGKTRLLLEMGIAHERRFGAGAVFVELEQVGDPGLVGTEIALALGRRPGGEQLSPDSLLDYLRERELLLLLDNFEQLLDAGPFVSELLRRAAGVTAVVSSRSPLRIRGERLFLVEPLALPVDDAGAEAAGSPAVRLFLERVGAGVSDVERGVLALGPAVAICRAVDGLPLAIELAAARVGMLDLASVAGQLSQPLALGSYALRDLPDRQQTLEAAIDWSYQLLGESAQQLLMAAAVFNGGFTEEALAAVAGVDVRVPLSELKEANLVRVTSQRHELLALVRAFAAERLARSGRVSELARGHWSYFRALAEPATVAFDEGVAPGEIAPPLAAEAANLRIALDRVIAAGDRDAAVALALGLRPLWLTGMLRQEAQDAIDRVLAIGGVAAADELRLLRVGSFLDGFRAGAHVWSQRLAARAKELGDFESHATALINLFALAVGSRDRDEMARLRPSVEALLEPPDGHRPSGSVFYSLALDAYAAGRFVQARDYAGHGLEVVREAGHDYAVATLGAQTLLAATAADERIEPAQLLEALELIAHAQVQPLMVFGLWFAARYAAGVDEFAMAAGLLARAESIRAALGLDLWPEEVLRDETLAVLRETGGGESPEPGQAAGVAGAAGAGAAGAGTAAASAPAVEAAAALADAISWLSGRPLDEVASRTGAQQFLPEG